jgi:hypothetical protein
MAMPAASSLALLMRLPVDRRSMAVDMDLLTLLKEAWAVRDLTLVLTTDME